MAPEGKESNAFANQVQSNCGRLNIGDQPINYLLSVNSNDSYFLDELSKLSSGEIDRANFTSDINSFYPPDANGPALRCIFEQLGDG